MSETYDFRKNRPEKSGYSADFSLFCTKKRLYMDTRALPRIGWLDIDRATAERIGPVLQTDKNGFFYCTAGRITLGLDGRSFEIRSGDLYLYPPFSQTYLGEASDDLGGVMGIADFDFVLSTLRTIPDTAGALYLREHPCISLDREQRTRIEELFDAVRRRKQDGEGIIQTQLLSALGRAVCYEIMLAYASSYPLRPLSCERHDRIFQEFLFALNRHFRTRRDVAFYAGLCCLTPRHFTTVIREKSGRTARQWITRTVIAEASRRLSDPAAGIKEIAEELGFPNQSFFGRYFKQYTGLSPSEYRAVRRSDDRAALFDFPLR